MPVYDYRCKQCQKVIEQVEHYSVDEITCPHCGDVAKRIISVSKVNTANEDAPWIRSVLEVVDKDSREPHVVEFRRNPTRENYKRWMKLEGLRPLENNERRGTKEGENYTKKITDIIMRERQRGVEIRTH